VSVLSAIIDDLKSLPPDRLELVAAYVRRLKPLRKDERKTALERTFGCLSREEADLWDRAIDEGCEQINEHGW